MVKVVKEVSQKPIPGYRNAIVLDPITEADDGEEVEIPFIKYFMTAEEKTME